MDNMGSLHGKISNFFEKGPLSSVKNTNDRVAIPYYAIGYLL